RSGAATRWCWPPAICLPHRGKRPCSVPESPWIPPLASRRRMAGVARTRAPARKSPMSIFQSLIHLPAVLLLTLLLLAPVLAGAREAPPAAAHVDADGPYVFRTRHGLRAEWICNDKVI